MIRTVGNSGGTTIGSAAGHAGQDTLATKIAAAETLAALKIRIGTGEGMPPPMERPGEAFGRFSAQLGLGTEILEGNGVREKAETLSRLRSEAKPK